MRKTGAILGLLGLAALQVAAGNAAELIPVFQDDSCQFTGVAVSKTGRMFVNYPRWQEPHRYDVVEVMQGGNVRPYPDEEWNQWKRGMAGSNKWICVQAVFVDEEDTLWVVDPAAPEMKKVEDDSAKLVSINLKENRVGQIYNLTAEVGRSSYLNDVRVDTKTKTAYLTESKNGGIIVVDLPTGWARPVLTHHFSVLADTAHKLTIDGVELKRNGKPFTGNSDGIALSPDRQWLYYKPLCDTKLYRIRTEYLRDGGMTETQLENKVEDLGANFTVSDGMIFDDQGNLYLSDSEHYDLVQVTPGLKRRVFIHDERLIWPDTFSRSPDGWLYISCSQIQTMPWSHHGKSTRTTPYTIYKFKTD